MIIDEPGWQLLDDFFLHEGEGRTAATARRYERIRVRLTQFLDVGDMAYWLGTDPATLLHAEREFHQHGAFWQLFGADELVCVLPAFVHEPWMPDSLADARTQVSLAGRLLTYLSRKRMLDLGLVRCAFWDAEAAVARARRDLSARSAAQEPDPWATEMPARFQSPPSPEW